MTFFQKQVLGRKMFLAMCFEILARKFLCIEENKYALHL
jgi:hypothetical protein